MRGPAMPVTLTKTILITGAASGIGRATARYFNRMGWYVGLYDINRQGVESLAGEIGRGNCCSGRMDVTDKSSVRRGMKQFSVCTGGRMNVLFANAGILRMGYNDGISMEDQDRIVDVNFKGVLKTIDGGMEMLKGTFGSRIIIMSSGSAITGVAQIAVYSATKAAVSSLAESLDMELDRFGIAVSDIKAPYVDTPLLQGDIQAASIGKLGVHLKAEDVARLVWKAAHKEKIHFSIGMTPFYFLMKLPYFLRKRILRKLLLPSPTR